MRAVGAHEPPLELDDDDTTIIIDSAIATDAEEFDPLLSPHAYANGVDDGPSTFELLSSVRETNGGRTPPRTVCPPRTPCRHRPDAVEERRKVGRTFVPAFVVVVIARTRTLVGCTAVLRRLLVIETQRHVQRLRLDSQLGQTEARHVREEPLSACCIN